MLHKLILSLIFVCGFTYAQALAISPYGLTKSHSLDTALVVHKYIPIVLHSSGANVVSALVSIFPTSTDSVFVCFDDTTSSVTNALLITPNTPRQFLRRATRVWLKVKTACTIHIDVEY